MVEIFMLALGAWQHTALQGNKAGRQLMGDWLVDRISAEMTFDRGVGQYAESFCGMQLVLACRWWGLLGAGTGCVA